MAISNSSSTAEIDQGKTVQTTTALVTWTALTNAVVTNMPMDVVDREREQLRLTVLSCIFAVKDTNS